MDLRERVLITGVAGFIGSNLAAALLGRGHIVVGLDNLSMGTLDNLTRILGHPDFRFVQGDVADAQTVAEVSQHVSVIVHLAALKIPRYGGRLDTLRTNINGGLHLLEAARRAKARFVLASTSDIYGQNPSLPFDEESLTVLGSSASARWSYAVSKLVDEHLAYAFNESYGVPSSIVRIFGSYGPNQHLSWWGGPQSVFIAAILRGRPVEIHGDGQQTRSFCFITDLVRGLTSIIERPHTSCEVFNLGSTEEISILELAKLVKRLSGTPGELVLKFQPYENFKHKYQDVRRRVPDISRAMAILGYEPRVTLEEGLRRTLIWQRERMAYNGILDLLPLRPEPSAPEAAPAHSAPTGPSVSSLPLRP